ncbi:MAG TPA: gliding motility lipoprotein GldD [Chitinophagales bacterium]|nr:gliding motility lipoprotein GldD [Chitinophagales bacterium]
MNSKRTIGLVAFVCVLLAACERDYTPRERGFFRLTLPERAAYQTYNSPQCPFTFEYPSYSHIQRDTVFLDTVPDNPCWLNLEMPDVNGTVFLSYKPIRNKADLEKVIDDAHNLTYRHTIKAQYINPVFLNPRENVYGLYYDVGGNAASNVQFFVTDSQNHFIRGALYFRNAPNVDSIKPVLDYVKHDVTHLINTLKWK